MNLCVRLWPTLQEDPDAMCLLGGGKRTEDGEIGRALSWQQLYPIIADQPSWTCSLLKSGRAMCNMRVHNVGGARLRSEGLPYALVVERRFPTDQLDTFVSLQGAAILYFEPLTPKDAPGYEALIAYLTERDRVGLGVEGRYRIMYIPPCEFARTNLSYSGPNLMGIVQSLAPYPGGDYPCAGGDYPGDS
ncbi:hypothetical protein T484DRAFT_1876232 [Baffinella frigidus]|nr:hypothetical protein T484DRAFT_1876232 [Cryptophyta sp. CCMP2293]